MHSAAWRSYNCQIERELECGAVGCLLLFCGYKWIWISNHWDKKRNATEKFQKKTKKINTHTAYEISDSHTHTNLHWAKAKRNEKK